MANNEDIANELEALEQENEAAETQDLTGKKKIFRPAGAININPLTWSVKAADSDLGVLLTRAEPTDLGYDFARYVEKDVRVELLTESVRLQPRASWVWNKNCWMEYLDKDFQWKLGKVVEFKFDEKNQELLYNIHLAGPLPEWRIRHSKVGLKALYGGHLLLIQQLMLLIVEQKLRFMNQFGANSGYHQDDFESFEYVAFGESFLREYREMFRDQMMIPDADFLKYKDDLISPLRIIESIARNDRSKGWDFENATISIYTYLSLLGTGFSSASIIFLFQFVIPLALLYSALFFTDGEPSTRFNTTDLGDRFLPTTDFDLFCSNVGAPEGKIVFLLAIMAHMVTSIPNAIVQSWRYYGTDVSDSTESRIHSIRRQSWLVCNDTISQEFWYKVDIFMNMSYIAFLYAIMILVLLNTTDVIEIVLNSFAFEFIHQFDEAAASTFWWDDNRRWLKAGLIDHYLRSEIQSNVFATGVKEVALHFNVDPEHLRRAVGEDASFWNPKQAKIDSSEGSYNGNREKLYHRMYDFQKANGYAYVSGILKTTKTFGTVENHISGWLKKIGITYGIFQSFSEFRVWSTWTKVLPPLPGNELYDLERTVPVEFPAAMHDKFRAVQNLPKTFYLNAKKQYRVITCWPIMGTVRMIFKMVMMLFEIVTLLSFAVTTLLIMSIAVLMLPVCY